MLRKVRRRRGMTPCTTRFRITRYTWEVKKYIKLNSTVY
jgi:hypothetical protein